MDKEINMYEEMEKRELESEINSLLRELMDLDMSFYYPWTEEGSLHLLKSTANKLSTAVVTKRLINTVRPLHTNMAVMKKYAKRLVDIMDISGF